MRLIAVASVRGFLYPKSLPRLLYKCYYSKNKKTKQPGKCYIITYHIRLLMMANQGTLFVGEIKLHTKRIHLHLVRTTLPQFAVWVQEISEGHL